VISNNIGQWKYVYCQIQKSLHTDNSLNRNQCIYEYSFKKLNNSLVEVMGRIYVYIYIYIYNNMD
jgi:hypothetical protein